MSEDVAESAGETPSSRTGSVAAIAILGFVLTFGVGMLVYPKPASPPQAPAAGPLPAIGKTAVGETIRVPAVGLTLVRPDGWSTVSADQNVRNIRSVRMDDPEFQELVARYATVPAVMIAKYPEPHDDLNPSFKVNVRPLGAFAGRPPEAILGGTIPILRRAFSDLTIEEGPTPTTVAGKRAAYARVAYTLRAGGQAIPTVSEFWIVPTGSVFLMIGAGTRADERNGKRAEMRAILDSIRIE
ncbi:MAG: hypothetical protein ACJ8E3_01490 [Sphingomicrobium sp.]